jgi:lipopolysaccharide transport system ATP-binding protein
MAPIIHVENVSKKFILHHEVKRGGYISLRDVVADRVKGLLGPRAPQRTQEEFWALKDLNFEVNQGDRLGIIGRNGAGKSTLLKILSRITEPTTGSIRIHGRVASLLEVGTGFHPELTGRENIFLNGAILGMSRHEVRAKFDEIVAFAEVEKFLDTPVKRYSSGMYVRLAFAVAAHLEPEILVVDEVLAVGDAQFQKKCLGKMEDVSNKEGRTVLFVSHNMGVIKHLCSKALLLQGGQVSMFSDVKSVLAKYSDSQQGASSEVYKHIAGDQSICIRKVIVNRANGIDVNGPLECAIHYEIADSANDQVHDLYHFFVLVHDSDGEVIWSLFQKDTGKTGSKDPGVIMLQAINILLPGSYEISVGIFDRANQFIDWVDKVESFEVLPVFSNGIAFDYRLGKVTSQALWV